jgi:hypothetical protein
LGVGKIATCHNGRIVPIWPWVVRHVLDADRNQIIARDKEDTLKIRAKLIIGRDGDEAQQHALRRLNGHLHRIEVLTFDQLLRIAQNVLNYLERAIRPVGASSGQ